MKINKSLSLVAAVAALSFGLGQSNASEIFDFTFSGPNESGQGTLIANSNGDGSFTAISGTGTEMVGGNPDAITLIANPAGTGATIFHLPGGNYYTYNDQLFPAVNPVLDINGLLFSSTSTSYNVLNIWGTGFDIYAYADSTPNGNFAINTDAVSFNLTDRGSNVPEPMPVALIGLGLVGLALARRKSGNNT